MLPPSGPAGAVGFQEFLDVVEGVAVNDRLVLAGEPGAVVAGLAQIGPVLQEVGEGPYAVRFVRRYSTRTHTSSIAIVLMCAVVCLAAMFLSPAVARAEDYPNRPIKIIT